MKATLKAAKSTKKSKKKKKKALVSNGIKAENHFNLNNFISINAKDDKENPKINSLIKLTKKSKTGIKKIEEIKIQPKKEEKIFKIEDDDDYEYIYEDEEEEEDEESVYRKKLEELKKNSEIKKPEIPQIKKLEEIKNNDPKVGKEGEEYEYEEYEEEVEVEEK